MIKTMKYSLLSLLVIIVLIGLYQPGSTISLQPVYGQQPFIYHFPIFLKLDPTFASTSYYMTTLNSAYIYNLGCQLGTRDKIAPGAQNSVAVLAFGYPRCFTAGGYGANLFGYGPVSINNVGNAIKQFALGYYTCTGSDNVSNLVIGAGTSNYLGGTEPCSTEAKSSAHGAAWSGMVRDLNQWALAQGIFHQVQVFGANDLEIGWNSPAWSRAWIAGFEQVSGNIMLNFGDAAGCPYEDKPSWSCGTYEYPEWTQEDVWYVSYGAPSALPLPLIYLTNGVHAKQWAYLSRYSVLQHGYRMDFTGVFTQWEYCQQFGWCNSTDNTPEMAHQQLSDELNKTPATVQNLPWKTDIRWIMQNEVTIMTEDLTGDESTGHHAQKWVNALDTALQETGLSPILQTSLETKQQAFQTIAEMAAKSQIIANPKQERQPALGSEAQLMSFNSGIFERGEIMGLPYGAAINHVWQGVTDKGYLQIGAGTAPGRPDQGALYILMTSPDHDSFQAEFIEAPDECGSLSILAENEGSLTLESAYGCQLTFDLRSWFLSLNP